MAEPRAAAGVGAVDRPRGAAARRPRLPAAPRCRPHPLRVLRARDALGVTAADVADDRARRPHERHPAAALARGDAARDPQPGRALPLSRGREGDQRPSHRDGMGEGRQHRTGARGERPGARHRRTLPGADGSAGRDRWRHPGARGPRWRDVPAMSVPWALQVVVRVEKDAPPGHTAVLRASGTAVVLALAAFTTAEADPEVRARTE